MSPSLRRTPPIGWSRMLGLTAGAPLLSRWHCHHGLHRGRDGSAEHATSGLPEHANCSTDTPCGTAQVNRDVPVPRARDRQTVRRSRDMTTKVVVRATVSIAREVTAIHQLNVGSMVERDLDHLIAFEEAEVVVEEVHLGPSRVLFGRVGAALAVSGRHVPSADRASVMAAAGALCARRFPHRRMRAPLSVSRSHVTAADAAAVVTARTALRHRYGSFFKARLPDRQAIAI